MEQKPTKQRNMKATAVKSEAVTENMVLKAESVLEVKNKKAVVVSNGTKSKTQTASPVQPTPTLTATAAKSKKTSQPTQTAQSVQPTQTAGAKTVAKTSTKTAQPVQPVQPTQTAQPTKGKKVQKAGTEKVLTTPVVAVAAVVAPTKKAAKTKKTETVAVVQEAGAKTKNVKKAAKVQKVAQEEALEEQSKSLDDKLRYFKLYYNDNICGRYSGKKPKQAANKAFSSIIKDMKKTDNKEGVNVDITFTIKECTRNSFHKEYKYVGKRLLLKSPVKVTIENGDGTSKDIVYKYHNELKKAPKV